MPILWIASTLIVGGALLSAFFYGWKCGVEHVLRELAMEMGLSKTQVTPMSLRRRA